MKKISFHASAESMDLLMRMLDKRVLFDPYSLLFTFTLFDTMIHCKVQAIFKIWLAHVLKEQYSFLLEVVYY